MTLSVLILCSCALAAQWQHYAFMKSRKTEVGKSELEELKSQVQALRVAQGFKR